MFANCQHGYLAMTCPQCTRTGAAPRAVMPAPAPAPRQQGKHYSGASLETRQFLADSWEDIMDRAIQRVDRTQFQHGVQTGALKRREITA